MFSTMLDTMTVIILHMLREDLKCSDRSNNLHYFCLGTGGCRDGVRFYLMMLSSGYAHLHTCYMNNKDIQIEV